MQFFRRWCRSFQVGRVARKLNHTEALILELNTEWQIHHQLPLNWERPAASLTYLSCTKVLER